MDRLKKAHGEFNTYLLENFIASFWHVCVFYFFGGGSAAGQIFALMVTFGTWLE